MLLQAPPLIVPRVIFELTPQDLVKVLEQPTSITDMIVSEVENQGLDGLVSSQKGGAGQGQPGQGWAELVFTPRHGRAWQGAARHGTAETLRDTCMGHVSIKCPCPVLQSMLFQKNISRTLQHCISVLPHCSASNE